MAQDVATRILDMAGLRIVGLGDPVAAGDATRTDNAHVPAANDGDGAPGTSLLAAPADHVHGAPTNMVSFSDPPLIAAPPVRTEIWSAVVDFDFIVGARVQAILSGLCRGSEVELWIDGPPGNPTAGQLLIQIFNADDTLSPVAQVSSAPFDKPSGPHLIALSAVAVVSAPTPQTAARVVTLRGLPPAP